MRLGPPGAGGQSGDRHHPPDFSVEQLLPAPSTSPTGHRAPPEPGRSPVLCSDTRPLTPALLSVLPSASCSSQAPFLLEFPRAPSPPLSAGFPLPSSLRLLAPHPCVLSPPVRQLVLLHQQHGTGPLLLSALSPVPQGAGGVGPPSVTARVGASLLLSSWQRIWAIQRNTKLSRPGFLRKPLRAWADYESPSRHLPQTVTSLPSPANPSPAARPSPTDTNALCSFPQSSRPVSLMVPCAGRWGTPPAWKEVVFPPGGAPTEEEQASRAAEVGRGGSQRCTSF